MKITSLVFAVALTASAAPSQGQLLECADCGMSALAVQQEPDEYRSTLFDRSHFTHAPRTDLRVVQYMPEQPAYRTEGYYERSAMRYNQSTIGHGRNADRMNIVETWGRGAEIRPYGEWERPYRRGAQPIWMTDPRAFYYSNNSVFQTENRDHVTFDNQTPRGKKHGGKYDDKGHGGKGHGGKEHGKSGGAKYGDH